MQKAILSVLALIGIVSTDTSCVSNQKLCDDESVVAAAQYAGNMSFPVSAGNVHINEINTRAVRSFMKQYREAREASWYKVKNGYVVRFKNDDREAKAAYKLNGDWVYTIKVYPEAVMPREIRHLVKRDYYDYTITLVEEIDMELNDKVFVVHIEDGNRIKLIRVINRELYVLKDFEKSR